MGTRLMPTEEDGEEEEEERWGWPGERWRGESNRELAASISNCSWSTFAEIVSIADAMFFL